MDHVDNVGVTDCDVTECVIIADVLVSLVDESLFVQIRRVVLV